VGGLVEVIPRSKGVRGNVLHSLELSGGVEEGNLVVPPAAALQRYHPCEQRTLTRDPVLRQSGSVCDAGFHLGLRPRLWYVGPLALWLVNGPS